MFMSDVNKKDEIKSIALQDLRKLGVKSIKLPKKASQKQQVQRNGSKVFKIPLANLPTLTVTLKTGQQIVVPKIIHELCTFIIQDARVEGLFRKEGSKPRQNEIKLLLNAGSSIYGSDYHVFEVAAVLKTFVRELPEPLIPYAYHDIFLKCVLLNDSNKLEAVLLTCLLLPNAHLNTLSYLMQFFKEISEYQRTNKMTAYNLAVCIGPSVFPVEDKIAANPKLRASKTAELFELLIENAVNIGVLSETIIERVGKLSDKNDDDGGKKKKRRSGSLTRMFNGIKKYVSGKNEENFTTVTPDLLLTPINRPNKRRINDAAGLSVKKKKDVLNKLPDKAILNTPFTPVNTNSNGNCDKFNEVKEKRSLWYLRSKSVKNLSKNDEIEQQNGTKLERRWSAVSNVANFRKNKKRNSCIIAPVKTEASEKNKEEDYVRVSKTEYEAIKNRVSEIERRISMELESVQCQKIGEKENDDENNCNVGTSNLLNVQTAYEQTLVQAKLSPTADQLARRLSRELKIRRSAEQKIIRSPSARKIGNMRRRSKEMERSKICRNQSWHVSSKDVPKRQSLDLKTGSPRRASSSANLKVSEKWTSAEGFFSSTLSTPSKSLANDRSSLAQLRSKNAGMVLAKAKLFDGLIDSDSSTNSNSMKPIPRVKSNQHKIGTNRMVADRASYRLKQTRNERAAKKSMSPRRRNTISQKQKLQTAKLLASQQRNNKENRYRNSPQNVGDRNTPVIKKSLGVKSPKRLCRTPGLDRKTPLKVLSTPKV